MGRSTFSGPVMVGPRTAALDEVGQVVLHKIVRFTFADATFSLELPANAEILEIYVDVIVAWDSVTSDVVDIGDGTTTDKFADALDLTSTVRLRATADVSQLANYEDIAALKTITGTITSVGGSLTVGDGRMIVLYRQTEPAQT